MSRELTPGELEKLAYSADPEGDLARAERDRLQRERSLADFAATFRSPEGQKTFWWLLDRLHFTKLIFKGNSTIYALAAERDLGQELLDRMVQADPGLAADILTAGLREVAEGKARVTNERGRCESSRRGAG